MTKIRLEKCDTDLYRRVVQEYLEAKILHPPSTALDADKYVKTLTKVLHVEAEATSPIRRKRKSKKGFPIWIDKGTNYLTFNFYLLAGSQVSDRCLLGYLFILVL